MKKKILHTIYAVLNDWPDRPPVACQRGCSACCSRNVTITALEGEEILRWVQERGLAAWLAEVLAKTAPGQIPLQTTNEFAQSCLAGEQTSQEEEPDLAPCPFLHQGICQIYPARPFACRLFISTERCRQGQAAVVPEYYFVAVTALCQVVEHLGQREYWGNMLDVLPALLDIREFADIATGLSSNRIIQARLRTRPARPLPGFLLPEGEEGRIIHNLLGTIFASQVAGRRIDDILNGR